MLAARHFDKTGTLTENRLRVVRLVPVRDGLDEQELLRLGAAGVGVGDDRRTQPTGRWPRRSVIPAGEDDEPEASLPFATGRGFPAALRDGRLVVKGPGSRARPLHRRRLPRTPVQKLAWEGLRVLAVAERGLDGRPDDLEDAAQDVQLAD